MPFVRGAHLRSHAARPYTFANSPVNGLLYVRGTIGGLPAIHSQALPVTSRAAHLSSSVGSEGVDGAKSRVCSGRTWPNACATSQTSAPGSECILKVWGSVCVPDAVRPCAGGSATVPEGEVSVRLYDGAIGPTYLAQAQAQASLSAAQQLAFSADLAPAEAGRHSGHVRVSGSIPLRAPLPAPAGQQRVASSILRDSHAVQQVMGPAVCSSSEATPLDGALQVRATCTPMAVQGCMHADPLCSIMCVNVRAASDSA